MRSTHKEVSSGISETVARIGLAAIAFGTAISQGASVEVAGAIVLGVASALQALAFFCRIHDLKSPS